MNKNQLISYFEALDGSLRHSAELYIYGSAACILLGEPERTSVDMDVAGPYSRVDQADFRRAAEEIGLPVNPDDDYAGDHIEWIGPLRLCLQPPAPGSRQTLWAGDKLTVSCGSVADLIASKLIRYDDIDRSDIQYMLAQTSVGFEDIAHAVDRLPESFAADTVLRENLADLKRDMEMWRGDRP